MRVLSVIFMLFTTVALADEIVIERHMMAENDRHCRNAGVDAPYLMEACAIPIAHGCRIIFPDGNAGDPYLRDLMAHELFHCRHTSWRHRHPRT